MKDLKTYREAIEAHIQERITTREPQGLYEPMVYIMNLGGKRLRPILTLLSAELFGGERSDALDAALAVEVFHNFSLVHDDIMDGAPLRRGKPTVHTKWDPNTGILSGDLMLIYSYKLLEGYRSTVQKALTEVFTRTAIQVCEGQQWDVEFEARERVELEDYIRMIQYKTAVLMGCALQMGAIVAGASRKKQERIYRYGLLLGTAFQLQDDYLDTFGDADSFGKRIGGDILEKKKTYLFIDALKHLKKDEKDRLLSLYSQEASGDEEEEELRIREVTELFRLSGSDIRIRGQVQAYTQKAQKELAHFSSSPEVSARLQSYGELLTVRIR